MWKSLLLSSTLNDKTRFLIFVFSLSNGFFCIRFVKVSIWFWKCWNDFIFTLNENSGTAISGTYYKSVKCSWFVGRQLKAFFEYITEWEHLSHNIIWLLCNMLCDIRMLHDDIRLSWVSGVRMVWCVCVLQQMKCSAEQSTSCQKV